MVQTANNKSRGFGIKSMISSYSVEDLVKDAFFPLIVSLILLKLFYDSTEDTYSLVCKVVGISLTVIPAMIALMLTAYVFVMSFLFGKDIVSTMKNPEEGNKLLYTINASFGISLLVNVSAVIIFFVVYCVSQIKISVEYADIINYIVLFGVSFLVLLSIVMQIGIVIDLFNCGQVLVRNSCEEKLEELQGENPEPKKE